MHFIRTGFRAVRENPALFFAEIAWRWAFGAAAWILIVLTVRTIMAGIDVSGVEVAIARTSDAYRIADAMARILVQVLPRFVDSLFVVLPLLALLWTIAATLGRYATLGNANIAGRSAGVPQAGEKASSRRFAYLLALNAVRAVFTLATFLAFFGTVFLVSSQFTPDLAPQLGPALMLAWMMLALLVATLWGLVNWFLALAPVFIVRDGDNPWKSFAASLNLYRNHRADYWAIASGFGLIRAAALLVAMVAGLVALAAGSPWAATVASIVVALAYFAVADFLYIARLAAYLELAAAPLATLHEGHSQASLAPQAPASDAPHLELET